MNAPSHLEQVLSNKGTAIDERDELSVPPDAADESLAEPTSTREDRIRLAAYASAERRGFVPGFETDDWLVAERQVDDEDSAGGVR